MAGTVGVMGTAALFVPCRRHNAEGTYTDPAEPKLFWRSQPGEPFLRVPVS